MVAGSDLAVSSHLGGLGRSLGGDSRGEFFPAPAFADSRRAIFAAGNDHILQRSAKIFGRAVDGSCRAARGGATEIFFAETADGKHRSDDSMNPQPPT